MDGDDIVRTNLLCRLFCVGFVVIALLLSTASAQVANGKAKGLPPPEYVTIEKVTSHSFTVRWKPPSTVVNPSLKLFSYIVVWAPVGRNAHEEKEVLLPPTKSSTIVPNLREDTEYNVVVSAVYTGYTKVPAPMVTAKTPLDKVDLAVSDDIYPEQEPDCNCSSVGMLACTRTTQSFQCTCFPGYEGQWCENCAADYFRTGKECQPCPCTNLTSTAECLKNDSGATVCKLCLPGHRGPLCQSCTAGYHWKDERCRPVNCLSFSLCAEEKESPGCVDCIFLQESLPPTAQKSNAERTIADGTVPLVAVIVTLGVIVLVAAGATCYRYWSKQRTRPRLPFWSIELREEKMTLSSECHYQHLDAASTRVVQAQGEENENSTQKQTTDKEATINV